MLISGGKTETRRTKDWNALPDIWMTFGKQVLFASSVFVCLSVFFVAQSDEQRAMQVKCNSNSEKSCPAVICQLLLRSFTGRLGGPTLNQKETALRYFTNLLWPIWGRLLNQNKPLLKIKKYIYINKFVIFLPYP